MSQVDIQKPIKGVWSHHFGKKWEEGFVAGNGAIGSILHGPPTKSILTGNHHRLFLIENDMEHLPDIGEHLFELRTIIEKEGYEKGIAFYEKKAIEKGYKGLTMSDLYHPAFQIEFDVRGQSGKKLENTFLRSLDYETGIVTQCYQLSASQQIKEEMFVSKEENCILFSVKSNAPFDLIFDIIDFEEELLTQQTSFDKDQIVQKNIYQDQTSYYTNISWDSKKTYEKLSNDKIIFKGLTEITFFCDITFNPLPKDLSRKTYNEIKERHILQHKMKYNKVEFDLVNNKERLRSIDDVFEEMETTQNIPSVLYEKTYDASRYIIQAMSGEALPNLQGIWSGDFSPAWSGDYTFDTNVELAISSLNSLGLFHHFEHIFSRLEEYFPDFEENAKKYYGARGYLVPAHASTTAKHVHWNKEWPLVFWFSGAGWLAHFYQEYYDYTQDLTFLEKKAIPFYEKTILFFEDIIEIQKNQALIRPSYSAENGMGDNATMDVAVLKEVIQNLIQAYQILDQPVPKKYFKLYQSLPEYTVNEEGSLKEWIDPDKKENYNHRHFSQFYPIFQSKEITKENIKLWAAAQKAFDYKLSAWLLNSKRENSSSHGRIHAAMCAISLERPEDVKTSINELYKNRAMYDSLITSHYSGQEVFNVDANGALPKIYHDALIYPENNHEITLLKAVPNWLEKGTIKGIRIPNGIIIDEFVWDIQKGELELILSTLKETNLVINLADHYQIRTKDSENKINLKLEKNHTEKVTFSFN